MFSFLCLCIHITFQVTSDPPKLNIRISFYRLSFICCSIHSLHTWTHTVIKYGQNFREIDFHFTASYSVLDPSARKQPSRTVGRPVWIKKWNWKTSSELCLLFALLQTSKASNFHRRQYRSIKNYEVERSWNWSEISKITILDRDEDILRHYCCRSMSMNFPWITFGEWGKDIKAGNRRAVRHSIWMTSTTRRILPHRSYHIFMLKRFHHRTLPHSTNWLTNTCKSLPEIWHY